jgi:serine O-acetyltransferase
MLKNLREDIDATIARDPAAKSRLEVVLLYPGFQAVLLHRFAHGCWTHGWHLLGRTISQFSRWVTGIEIHPGARIGRRCFIDHGMGVVIGETSEIGDNVRLYHGVTLGAFSPRRGQTIRGTKRHPTLEDDVIIYPGATILGGETVIGRGSVVNGNAYVTESVPPESRVVPEAPRQMVRRRGGGKDAEQLHWEI